MPTGMKAIKRLSEEAKARKAEYANSSNVRFFKINDGETAVVRFLEQDDTVEYYYVHELPAPKGRQWGDRVLCLDQEDEGKPCPGCELGKKRSRQMPINVIVRNAPLLKREAPTEPGKLGKPVKDGMGNYVFEGHADQVFVWTCGPQLMDQLVEINEDYAGLMSQDFRITRHGTKTDTEYKIKPAVGGIAGQPKPMSEADVKLASDKFKLKSAMREISAADMQRAYAGLAMTGTGGESPAAATQTPAPSANRMEAAAASSGGLNRGAFGI